MIFLISILFIIEITIATTIIVSLVYFDRKITKFNDKVLENRYKVRTTAENIKITVKDFFKLIRNHGEKIIEKERKFFYNIVKSSILGIIFMLASKQRKKQILLVELLMIAYETYKTSLEA